MSLCPGIHGQSPHGTGIGALATGRALGEIHRGHKVGRRHETRLAELTYGTHHQATTAATGAAATGFPNLKVAGPAHQSAGFSLDFYLQGFLDIDLSVAAPFDPVSSHGAHEDAIIQRPSTVLTDDFPCQSTHAKPHGKIVIAVENITKLVGGHGHGDGIDALVHGQVTDPGGTLACEDACKTRVIKRYKQICKFSVPVSKAIFMG